MIAITSLPLTVVMEGTQYLFQDWEFAKWIAVAIAPSTPSLAYGSTSSTRMRQANPSSPGSPRR